MRLSGKTAIVTGGGSGFGAGIARKFGAEGAQVMVADINPDAAAALVSEVGGLAQAVDVSDADSVAAMALRVHGFYADLMQAPHPGCVVVCHAGTMRLMHSLHLGGTLVDDALRAAQAPHRIDYGEVMMLET